MVDTTAVIDGILPDLHAASRADLVFWDPTDLIRWCDECVKHLARLAPVFAIRDTSLATAANTPTYALPPRHVATMHVSVGTSSLRPANANELEGLNPAFRTDQGPPARWYEDTLPGSGALVGLAPVPAAAGAAIPVVYASFPPEVDVAGSNTLVPAPPPVKGYMAMYILAEAYQIEGESEMPDVAAHAKGRLQLYEQAFAQYFGKL
jgi:hypothetical protein